jgi:RepB DNA-primase from phage plasmid
MHKYQAIAAEFLAEWFAAEETFALLVRLPDQARTLQRIVRLADLMKSNYLGWLAFENCRGGNVYFSINPLVPGATRRTKDAVAEAKGLYLDLDSDGDAKLAAIRSSENVPAPTAVIQTSTGKYQALWRAHGFTIPAQEAMLKILAETFGGDRACTDCARVFRLPGFFNRKYAPAPLVTVEIGSNQPIYCPTDFRLEMPVIRTIESTAICPAKPGEWRTQSEADWKWVIGQLRAGNPADEVVRILAASRLDKPNPIYYAQRTVDVANAVIWARNGIAPESIVRQLEKRSSSRAAEIAATALRFVGRFRIHHPKEN